VGKPWRISVQFGTLGQERGERCVDDARNHGHTLRALLNFNYYEDLVDRGMGVREKSKQLIEM
jgi:hypothetical protein